MPGATGRAALHPARRIEHLIVLLLILAAVGVGITKYAPMPGFWYWVAMVPTFGLACGYSSWARVRARGETVAGLVQRQALHWLGLLAAVGLIYLLTKTGRIDSQDAGLIALLCLALTTFLAGVHADWRISAVGGLLGGVVFALALVEQFVWVVFLMVAVSALLALFVWRRARDPR